MQCPALPSCRAGMRVAAGAGEERGGRSAVAALAAAVAVGLATALQGCTVIYSTCQCEISGSYHPFFTCSGSHTMCDDAHFACYRCARDSMPYLAMDEEPDEHDANGTGQPALARRGPLLLNQTPPNATEHDRLDEEEAEEEAEEDGEEEAEEVGEEESEEGGVEDAEEVGEEEAEEEAAKEAEEVELVEDDGVEDELPANESATELFFGSRRRAAVSSPRRRSSFSLLRRRRTGTGSGFSIIRRRRTGTGYSTFRRRRTYIDVSRRRGGYVGGGYVGGGYGHGYYGGLAPSCRSPDLDLCAVSRSGFAEKTAGLNGWDSIGAPLLLVALAVVAATLGVAVALLPGLRARLRREGISQPLLET